MVEIFCSFFVGWGIVRLIEKFWLFWEFGIVWLIEKFWVFFSLEFFEKYWLFWGGGFVCLIETFWLFRGFGICLVNRDYLAFLEMGGGGLVNYIFWL